MSSMTHTPQNQLQPTGFESPAVPAYEDKDMGSRATTVSSTLDVCSQNGCFEPIESDKRSTDSYTSSTNREYTLKAAHGRTINNASQLYFMPADVAEHGRLDIQHEALKVHIGALYLATELVRQILAPRPEGVEKPAVLDIATGSGSWAIDMAEEFPHAEVVGLDIVPPNLARPPPPNCRFECHDVNQGLSHYRNSYDAIHIRCAGAGFEDGLAFYHSLPDLLRPGGIFLVVLGDYFHGEDQKILVQEDQSDPDFSWVAFLTRTYNNETMARAMRLLPEKADRCGALGILRYQDWLKKMPEWETQDHQKFLIPLGAWKADMNENERYVAELMRQNILKVVSSWRPALLINGFPEESVDQWIANAQDEILNRKTRIYVGWQASWALKPGKPVAVETVAQ